MFPSETRLFALLDTLRDELTPERIYDPRVSAGPVYQEAVEIFIAYPGASPITVSLFIKQGHLVARVIPRRYPVDELTHIMIKSVYHILQLILPNVIFLAHPWSIYRRNTDDDLRKAERKWKETGSEEDQKRYETVARRAGLCPKCQEQTLLEDNCQICEKSSCENCDSPTNCGRCGDWVCDDCQRQCNHCGNAYGYECVKECPHCKEDFCIPGIYSPNYGHFVNAPGCFPPGPDGHGCPDWDEQPED